jgi:hypothetical protein
VQSAVEVLKAAGGTVVFVELVCTEDELETRVENVSRKEFGKLDSVTHYRALKTAGAFQYPKLPSGLTVDTTSLTPAETAELIRDYIEAL